ncbi:Superfamily II DNA or RNA helicase, SNF2 family [Nocardioides scoriae]|uniref:Superfamily II DNA or RNA helicase, SNF2 family n=1 Tax=Nocardioides scoriae TaxID=642780 RepID=A0A1H1UTL3_9ACTN|nr:DEAD/DEAH box helicase [Nocardioides scoriae]SDS75795.1 Superfamily II DNA or RNA helicase, SNF2 family [Nocardioides scoriae]
MSFVPLQGQATWLPQQPARHSEVEFSGPRRSVRLPLKGAIPVLTRAVRVEDAHPSVGLLSGATLLAMKLVAAGRVRRTEAGDAWRIGPLQPDDDDRVRALATSRAHAGTTVDDAEEVIRQLLDAVADTMVRAPGATSVATAGPDGAPARTRVRWAERLAAAQAEAEDPEPDGLPDRVRVTLRLEAPEEVLAGGGVVLVPQAHDLDDETVFVDVARLWREGPEEHGFSARARLSATVALGEAAQAWEPLGRLLREQVPDQLLLDGEELTALLDGGLEALDAVGVDVFWPRGLRSELVPQGRVEVDSGPREGPLMDGLFGPDSLFRFDWRLALAGQQLSDEEMLALAEATTPVIRLRDNWVVIDPVVARRARKRVKAGLDQADRPIAPAAALQAALTGRLYLDGGAMEVHPGATLEKVRDRVVGAATAAPLPDPPGLRATLRDYQRQGVTWLAELTGAGLGACLADDMGLGKTVTLIALHLHRRDRGLLAGPTLVVCPASLLGNWKAEIRRFAPGVDVRRFHGASRSLVGVGDGFVLTTYGTMRADTSTEHGGDLAAVGWDLVVADEAQHVKNARSTTARNLRTLTSRCRVALTGTPVENDLTELWAILDWATPGLLGSRNAFRKVWAAPIESGVDPSVARRFAQLVEPFLLRRRKTDPGIAPELPAKTETDHVVGLTREQVVLYETLVRESMRRIEDADEDTRRGLVLALLTGLKQICNHPAHYLRQPGGRLRGRSHKLELLDELLATILAEGGAVLLFTQYVEMARLLERHLAAAGTPTLFLHGGTPVATREQLVRDFQAGAAPVFLLSLKAGGTGLNLTRADHVVHVDRWWNPAVEDQATDRAHRIGQTRPVQVHRLITEGTIEERVGELLARKRSLADAVLGRGEAALTELSDAELHDLVSLRRTGLYPDA